jgi:mevalonate kinase
MNGDADELGACLDEAQGLYEDELAGTFPALRAPALIRACQELRAHGALGAKFSGAGGDGSVIALMPDPQSARAAVDLLEVRGLHAWYCPFGEEPA